MGWPAPEHRQWMCVTRKWCRLANFDDLLLAKRIFQSHLVQCNASCKTWCYRVQMFFREIEFGDIGHGHRHAVGAILRTVNTQLQLYYDKKWKDKLENEFARRGGQDAGGNKVETSTYRRFKESYSAETFFKFGAMHFIYYINRSIATKVDSTLRICLVARAGLELVTFRSQSRRFPSTPHMLKLLHRRSIDLLIQSLDAGWTLLS